VIRSKSKSSEGRFAIVGKEVERAMGDKNDRRLWGSLVSGNGKKSMNGKTRTQRPIGWRRKDGRFDEKKSRWSR
jgi:hypothetical protein